MRPGRESEEVKPCMKINKRTMLINIARLLAELVAVAMVVIVALYGEGNPNSVRESDGSLQRVLDAGRLVLGLDVNFPPMSFTGSRGEIIGFDADMVQAVCNRLGVSLIMRPIQWNSTKDALNEGTVDCIGGISLKGAATREMKMSEAYLKEDLVFVVPGNSSIRWLRDLKGKTVGVQAGSTTQEALNASRISKDVSVSVFDDNLAVLQQMRRGKVHAALVDSTVAYYFIDTSNYQFFVLDDTLGEDELAIGFRKKDIELRDRVQDILSDMRFDGTLGEISKKWFGSDITTVR